MLRTFQGMISLTEKLWIQTGIPYKVGPLLATSFINKDPITPFIVVKIRPQIAMYFFGHL